MGVNEIRLIISDIHFCNIKIQSTQNHIAKMLYMQSQMLPVPVFMEEFMSCPPRRLPCRRTFDVFSKFSTVPQSAGVPPVTAKRQKAENHTGAAEQFPETISMDLTGFKPKDIKINMTTSGVLNVTAQRIHKDDDCGRVFQQMCCFQRSIKVPDHILAQGADKIKSVLIDGRLEFTFPITNNGSPSIEPASKGSTSEKQSSPVTGKKDCEKTS